MRAWLEEPVEHVRDLRSALLLKLVLGRRAGVDQRQMLERQLELLGEIEGSLAARGAQAAGTEELLLAVPARDDAGRRALRGGTSSRTKAAPRAVEAAFEAE